VLDRADHPALAGQRGPTMTDDDTGLPVPIATGGSRVLTVEKLASNPEEQIWLQKQKSTRTRRAYRLDV
jgi:hypothetical protein